MEISFRSYTHYVARAERYLLYDIKDGESTETDLDYLTMLSSCTHDEALAEAVNNVSEVLGVSYADNDAEKTYHYTKYQFVLAHQKNIAQLTQYPAGL